MDISVTVFVCLCVRVCLYCYWLRISLPRIKLTAVHRHPRQGISHFGELCLIGLYLQLMLMHLNKDLISVGNFKILYTIF